MVSSREPPAPAMSNKGNKGKKGAKGGGGKAAAEMGLPVTTTTSSFNSNEPQDAFELKTCVEALQDKRRHGPTREQDMAELVRVLEALPPLDELESLRHTILAFCGVSIKKGSSANAKQARLAYRVVGLLAITLHARAASLLHVAFPMLSKMLQVEAWDGDEPTLVAALNCLAAVTFACAQVADDVKLSMKAIWAVIFPPASRSTKISETGRKTTTAQVLVAAVSAWTLLVTITPAERKKNHAAWNATVASLAELLENDDRTVRMAAGEALAVCVELNLVQNDNDMDTLMARVCDLATEAGGHGVSKTMLREQRHRFRQMVALLIHDERPKESSVTVRELPSEGDCGKSYEVLKVSTCVERVQLHFLRRFLGGGFLKHVQDNELFKKVFSFDVHEASEKGDKKKKTKQKSKAMNYMRDVRWESKNY